MDVLKDVLLLANEVGAEAEGRVERDRMDEEFERIRRHTVGQRDRPTLVVLESLDPLIVSGGWIPEMADIVAGEIRMVTTGDPAREIAPGALLTEAPETLVLCLRDRPVEEARRAWDACRADDPWRSLPAVREGRVAIVDGLRYFHRPGPGLVESHRLLAAAAHPKLAGRFHVVETNGVLDVLERTQRRPAGVGKEVEE